MSDTPQTIAKATEIDLSRLERGENENSDSESEDESLIEEVQKKSADKPPPVRKRLMPAGVYVAFGHKLYIFRLCEKIILPMRRQEFVRWIFTLA